MSRELERKAPPGSGVNLACSPEGVLLPVRVIPRARQDALDGVLDGALKLRLASPPVDGKANAACVAFVASVFGLRRSQVELVRGEKGRQKVLLLRGIELERAHEKLLECLAGR